MAALFSKPKMPTPPKQTPTPTIDDAARTEEMTRKFARRRGRMATDRGGSAATPSVAVKTLLGG